MQNNLQINSAQAFVRGVVFFVVMFISLIFVIPVAMSGEAGKIVAGIIFFLFLWVAGIAAGTVHILPEWNRLVLLRLGKYAGIRGPGIFFIPPFVFSVASVIDIRIRTQKVEATATLTKDNVPTTVTAALEYEIEDPKKAVIDTQNYLNSVVWLTTEALKNTIGGLDLKELLSNRDEIADSLRVQIDADAANYGVNVRAMRITDIDTPKTLIEELAVIARARRAAQAKQIQAEAEVVVAQKVAEASQILAQTPGAYKLRELQNLATMSKEESSMIIIYPMDSPAGQEIAHSAINRV